MNEKSLNLRTFNWCQTLGIPTPVVKYDNETGFKACINCNEGIIFLNPSKCSNNKYETLYVFLHELAHWWYFWKYPGRHKDERRVMVLSTYLIKKFGTNDLFRYSLLSAATNSHSDFLREHHPEYIDAFNAVLKKFKGSTCLKQ